MPRALLAAVLCALALVGASCDDGSLGSTGETVPFVPQVEATDPPVSTIPAGGATLEMIVDGIHASVLDTLGVVLTVEDDRCIRASLLEDVDPDALVLVGLDGVIGEQPIPVQTQIFGVFDRCVTPDHYAELLGPILAIAGADPDGGTCFFKTLRETLGFAGMYRVAAGESGELDRDETLLDAVSAIYDRCDVDPSTLTPPTSPPPSTSSTTSTTSTQPPPSTSAPPSTPPTTLPVLSTTTSEPA
jgi:hypothetical protein